MNAHTLNRLNEIKNLVNNQGNVVSLSKSDVQFLIDTIGRLDSQCCDLKNAVKQAAVIAHQSNKRNKQIFGDI